MMKKFYNSRVIHSPLEQSYTIEVKEHWWSAWHYYDMNFYKTDDTFRYSPRMTQEVAEDKTIARAKDILKNPIIYIAIK